MHALELILGSILHHHFPLNSGLTMMSTLMVGTQQVEKCKAFKERQRWFIAVNILVGDVLLAKHLITRYKFIPTQLSCKETSSTSITW